jgi:3-hydroxy-9,10-secoandrosta-1,3,5(10)-triene-9,17-dione monooxygenase reductase component
MVGEVKFREVMGHFATGVTVVTSRGGDGEPVGLTVNAFTSVSLHPPLVLVCLHRDAAAHDPLLEAGHFAVSVLGADQDGLAVRFATVDPESRFLGVDFFEGILGGPRLQGAIAWLDCRVKEVYRGGDHSIIVGEVVACESAGGDPLLFHRGTLGRSTS